MTALKLLLIVLLPFAFASCMDTREELVVKSDGSGTLTVKTDMSKMVGMMKTFASDSDIKSQGLDRPFDTVMLVKSYVDTAQGMAAGEKEVLRNGQLHLSLDVKASTGKLDMLFPFVSADQIPLVYEGMSTTAGSLKDIMGKSNPGQQDDKSLPQITTVYDISVKNGLYSRKVNKERYQVFSQTLNLDQLKQIASVVGPMNYTLVVTLPRPIKKAGNAKAVLSNDRKTATLSNDLLETFEHPELMELELEY
jgi:hypothetical protein